MIEPVRGFTKTARQREALDLLNKHRHVMLEGGARSGKTFIAVRNVFLRGTKRTSKHLIVRYRLNHARTSLMHETIPDVLRLCFPGLDVHEDRSEFFYSFPADDGGTSEVWIGGTDSAERVEKVLGNEYSTIYANECSQIPFNAITTLWTRLAETSGLNQRFYYDCNPPAQKHWTHKLFHESKLPDGEPHNKDTARILMNPKDNEVNLSPEFMEELRSLPKRQRQRYWEGLYLSEVEGALWTDQMVTMALAKDPAPLRKTVIALDPSVSNNPNSDECGIVVCSLDERKHGVVHADHSGKLSTKVWAQRAVNLFHTYEANEIVAEKNQGGDLVMDAIHHVDPHVPVVLMHASKGKFARAEPISMLYETGQEKVAHLERMPKLEAELTETVFTDVKESPNRLDALCWGLTYLMKPKTGARVHIGGI